MLGDGAEAIMAHLVLSVAVKWYESSMDPSNYGTALPSWAAYTRMLT